MGVPILDLGPPQVPILDTNVATWRVEGRGYELKCDVVAGCLLPVLRSRPLAGAERGALAHHEWAAPWRGARVEARGELRSGMVSGEATVVIRAEDAAGQVVAEARSPPMTGTTAFRPFDVTLQVPASAERLSLLLELSGSGALFVRQVRFDDAELFASR